MTENSSVLSRFGLTCKGYLHFGSYGPSKGQKVAFKHLKHFGLPMIATSSSNKVLKEELKDVKFINANFEEYNILLKNAKAMICMSELRWCRVLQSAIHGTPIMGSGLGGMGGCQIGFTASKPDELINDLNSRTKEISLSKDKINFIEHYFRKIL